MKILLIMDPGILVPPTGYGGIERIVAMLANEYRRLGHDVHLLVTKGSFVEGCIMHPFGQEGFPPKKIDTLLAIPAAWKFLWKHRNDFDLVHNFGRLLYLLPVLNQPVKKIMSYQREITKKNIQVFNIMPNKNMAFTGCSASLVKRANAPGKWYTIHNGIDFNRFTISSVVDTNAPLIFLGRIERVKGCHTAIEVAKKTNMQLVIAGNISKLPEEIAYYEQEIKPHVDGTKIIFIGEVNDVEKNHWLGKAKALIMPIEWDEPFGIVMIEAMACGTPVVAYNRGSVSEVITDKVTGHSVNNIRQMAEAVSITGTIDRVECRKKARNNFDISQIANKYLSIHNYS